MSLIKVTSATALPVSLADIKAVMRLESSAFDAALELMRPAAHQALGELLGASLGEEAWKLTLDAFSDSIALQRGPVTAVTAFTHVDPEGVVQAVDPALYTLDALGTPAWIVRNSDAAWPATLDAVNVVSVTFTAGWTDATLPDPVRLAVAALVQHWWENGAGTGVPDGIAALVAPWRSLWICA